MTDRYAVLGNPVAHSRSPIIHAQFALQTQQDLSYDKRLIALDSFASEVERMIAQEGFKGFNVTMPFKLDALDFVAQRGGQVSARAQLAGAVNTIKVSGETLLADNTDGIGLVTDVQLRLGTSLAGKQVMLLGAGGAARGVIPSLLEAGVASLVIANRTLSTAASLVNHFSSVAKAPMIAIGLDQIGPSERQVTQVLINAISGAAMPSTLDSLGGPWPKLALAYDLVYGAQPTSFMQWAHQAGVAQVSDGLGMLVEQAAEAFAFWRGLRPNAEPVLRGLRQALAS